MRVLFVDVQGTLDQPKVQNWLRNQTYDRLIVWTGRGDRFAAQTCLRLGIEGEPADKSYKLMETLKAFDTDDEIVVVDDDLNFGDVMVDVGSSIGLDITFISAWDM